MALRKHGSANNGQFPDNLSQLQPYCDPVAADMLLQLYEIIPVTVLPERTVEELNIKDKWAITRKSRVNSNSTSRLAITMFSSFYWQSPP